MAQAVDVAALLDRGSWSGYQKLVTSLAALAIIFDGFDIQILGFAIPSLMREWSVARSDFGAVLAIGLAGMVIGGPIGGYCGDRWGRRVSLICCVALFGAATVATAFVHSLPQLAALRFATGMGTGAALPVASAFAAEFAPLRWRPTAVKLTLVCVPLGGMLGGVLAARVLPAFGWRGLYAAGGVLPAIFVVGLWVLLPESPRYLARRPDLAPSLARLLRRMGHDIAEGSTFEDRAETAKAPRASMRALFQPRFARDTAGLWFACFFCLGSIYLVFGWLPAMLTARGLDVATASSGLAAYNLGGILGVVVWAALLTLLGSRGPMLSAAAACAGSAFALLAAPIQAQGGHATLIAALALNGLLANAVQVSMYALAAHVYPTSVRATGVGYVGTIGRAGGLLASLFGSSIIQAGGGAFFYTLAIAMVLAFAGLASVRSHYPALVRRAS